MSLTTLALTALLSTPLPHTQTDTIRARTLIIQPAPDTIVKDRAVYQLTVPRPTLNKEAYSIAPQTHPVHIPHATHLPVSMHRSRLTGLERNFPYDHLSLGVHAQKRHIGLELDFELDTELHEHDVHTYIAHHRGIGLVLSYRR